MAGQSGGDKTEKATPKKRDDARKKGQVAKSQDVLHAGGAIAGRMQDVLRTALVQTASPEIVEAAGIGTLLMDALTSTGLAVAPVAGACLAAGVLASVIQVGFKPSLKAAAPDPKRMNPLQGIKKMFSPHALMEGGKSIVKVSVVAAIVAAAIVPELATMGTLVGMTPAQLAAHLADEIQGIATRAALAYLVIGVFDVAWQRYQHEKQLKMTLQEVKEEQKGQSLPPEVRMAMRRRQMMASRSRMMAAVPEADVIVTNPTHFSVALKYEAGNAAPIVVAKGQDVLALRIREIAGEHGVPIIPNPPLTRALYQSVDVGRQIPEEFFAAVAQVLAHVYRLAGRRAA